MNFSTYFHHCSKDYKCVLLNGEINQSYTNFQVNEQPGTKFNLKIYIAYWKHECDMHEFISLDEILRFKMQVIWSKMYKRIDFFPPDSSLIQGESSRRSSNEKISGKAWGRVKVTWKHWNVQNKINNFKTLPSGAHNHQTINDVKQCLDIIHIQLMLFLNILISLSLSLFHSLSLSLRDFSQSSFILCMLFRLPANSNEF